MRRPRVEFKCAVCGAVKSIKPSEIGKGGGKHCSRDCYNTSRAVPRVGNKACRRCEANKPVENFPQRSGRPEGERGPYCVPCAGAIGKPGRIRYATTAKGIAAKKRSEESESAKESHRRSRARRAADGRDAESHRKWIHSHHEYYLPRHAARQRLYKALKRGDVVRPTSCEHCANPCKPHGHHHLGYDGENALKVLWLCRRCHDAEHMHLSTPSRAESA